MSEPAIIWTSGHVVCSIVHHPGAQSHEVQVRDRGTVILRRWFDDHEAAALFALETRREFD